MVVKTLSVWSGVPDAERLKTMLLAARDASRSVTERQQAISYLTGACKVLAGIEKRRALADYLLRQLRGIKATLHTTGSTDADQAHG